MTFQRVFNKVARHLLKQNAKAVVGINCKYRTPDGKKCAAGCLIPDELYSPSMEGLTIDALAAGRYKLPKVITENLAHVKCLQIIHDVHPTEAWREELTKYATNLGLNTRALT